jgi:stage V sporulation protein SpoVS
MNKQDYKVHDTQPNNIVFMMDYGTTEVLRISKEGVWANPDFTADETAKKVLEILDVHVKAIVNAAVEQERKEFAVHAIDIARKAIEEEREACAKICDDMGPCGFTGESCAAAIRARGEMK